MSSERAEPGQLIEVSRVTAPWTAWQRPTTDRPHYRRPVPKTSSAESARLREERDRALAEVQRLQEELVRLQARVEVLEAERVPTPQRLRGLASLLDPQRAHGA
jgi:hypothetical protein